MDANWSRIWLDFRITFYFLTLTITIGLGFILVQGVGARAPAFLWALAMLASGGLVGFLFGIPRVLQDSSPTVAVQTPNEQSSAASNPRAYRMQVNTNLEQISDWLTKIIVGIGLIELRNVTGYLGRLSLFIAGGLGNPTQSQVLAIALVLYFSVLGFLGGYLMTRIYLAQAFSRADWGAQNTIVVAGAELTISEVSEQSRNFLADLQDQVMNLQKVTATRSPERLETATEHIAGHVKSILWVDDNPKNNSFIVERLTKLGIRVKAVLSTAEALSTLKAETFDRIISDMGRLEPQGYNHTAGLDLVRALGEMGNETPLAFYCSAEAVTKYGDDALRLGAREITTSPTRLLNALEIEV